MPGKLKRKEKPSKDPYPLVNDWLEVLIIFTAGVGVFTGFVALYYLSQQV
jgi:hypothetical protein